MSSVTLKVLMWVLYCANRFKCYVNRLTKHSRTKLYLIILLSLVAILSFVSNVQLNIYRQLKVSISNDLYCYRYKDEPTLPDVLNDDPPKEKSIFFHETSCASKENNKITISARQACAVESAARLNPNLRVYVLFTSPGVIKSENNKNYHILKQLMMYKNIRLKHLNFKKYLDGSPINDLYTSLKIEASTYARSHASDVLRYLTLWRYGGIYLDLDVVLIKSLEKLKLNFAGRESDWAIAAGAISFSYKGQGHRWARKCLEDLKINFDGGDWGTNGPGVITRLLKTICNNTKVMDMNRQKCNGFSVFPPSTFYPIPWMKWNYYFDENHLKDVLNSLNDSIAIHVWNKHSVNTKISTGSDVPYEYIAKKFCPRVYAASEDEF